MAYTIGSDTYTATSPQHPTVHNNITDVLIGMGAVYNVLNTAYSGGAKGNGVADDYAAIQAALTACRTSTYGGVVIVPPGIYIISESLQIGSNTTLLGAGWGCTVIRAVNSFAATQVGSGGTANSGMVMLATYNNGAITVTNIKIAGIQFDGNQANIASLPGYADNGESAPVGLWNCSQVTVQDCSVINAIGYSIYLQSATHFTVQGNYILSGQGGTSWMNQDGIHVTGGGTAQYGLISGNDVNTGTGSAGDDCIALQSFTTIADVVIQGNRVTGGGGGVGIDLVMGATNATITNVVINGNDIQSVANTGIAIYEDAGSSGWLASNITISNNTIGAWNGNGEGGNSGIALANSWKNVVISGNSIAVPSSTAGGSNVAVLVANGTGFTVTGNFVTVTGASINAVTVENSTNGVVTGNTLIGASSSTTFGVQLLSNGTAVTGVAVTGNRISGFTTGAGETNTSGSGNHNACIGNAFGGATIGTFGGANDASLSTTNAT